MMDNLPSGTVTFLFTDIEGSTALAMAHPGAWEVARQRHHEILRNSAAVCHGYVFQVIGDAFCVAFSRAPDALQAASLAQVSLLNEDWGDCPIRVRMGIHTGDAEVQKSGEYRGYLTLSRVQRVVAAGHGGQILVSQATRALVQDELSENMELFDLGEHRLKNLDRPEHIYQLNTQGLPTDFPPIITLEIAHHNLPVQITSFIGREKEIADIKQALQEHRLVTLTGAGGAGKTRLSLQVADGLLDEYKDGVWFVDLAPLSEAAFVPQAIATVLNVRQGEGLSLVDLLASFLQRRELLLLLDNCEHLVEACASIVELLLRSAPELKIIATSREGLGVAGEKVYAVPSLSFSQVRGLSPAVISQYDASRLFVDRATLAQTHFSVTTQNAPAIAQICRRLDGIPLAIELAAARVKAMSVEQIAARLDDRFRLLTGGSRTAMPRQQTLRALIDWSWELLSTEEQALLGRLSVFSGGWTLETAEFVCAGDGVDQVAILDLLAKLVNKSLVIWNDQLEEPRYFLLETIRQYASDKLRAVDKENSIPEHHAAYYVRLAEQAALQFYSPTLATWMKCLDQELDNLRAALEWSVKAHSAVALRLVKALGDYWFWNNMYAEGIQWIEQALSSNPDGPLALRAYAMVWAAANNTQLGRKTPATQYGEAGLELARQSDDQALITFAVFIRGSQGVEFGDAALANECFEQALPAARSLQLPFVLPGVLGYLGLMLISGREYVRAEAYFQESVEMSQKLSSPFWQPMSLMFSGMSAFLRGDISKARDDLIAGREIAQMIRYNLIHAHLDEMLGRIQILDGDFQGARARLAGSLAQLQDMSLKPCLAHGLESWARLALAQGQPNRAARLLAAITAHMQSLGMNMIPVEQAMYDQTLAAVQKQLDPAIFRQEWIAGEKLSVDQAIELAMRED